MVQREDIPLTQKNPVWLGRIIVVRNLLNKNRSQTFKIFHGSYSSFPYPRKPNSAHHKCWDSSVNHVKPSLRKALRANDLLSENDLAEDWGSRYLGNPRSLAPFLPKQTIKSSPSSVQVSQHRRPLVIMSTNSYTKCPSIVVDSLSIKCLYVSNPAEL